MKLVGLHPTALALFFTGACGIGCATSKKSPEEDMVKDPTSQGMGSLQIDVAQQYVDNGNYDAAVPLIRQSLSHQPKNARLHTMMGVVLREKGLFGQSEKELQEAVKLDGKYAPAYDALAVLHARMKQFGLAITEHKKAVELDASCVRCWNNLGFSYYLNGQFKEAVGAYEHLLRADPSQRSVYNNLGFAYGRLGDDSAALRAFRQAMSEPDAQRNLTLVKQMRTESAQP